MEPPKKGLNSTPYLLLSNDEIRVQRPNFDVHTSGMLGDTIMLLGQRERNAIEAYIAHRSVAIGWRVGRCIADRSLAGYGARHRPGCVGIIRVVVGIVGHCESVCAQRW